MPYLAKSKRVLVHPAPRSIAMSPDPSPGELNYAITALVKDYLESRGTSYATINEVIGVLECAKLELYRRVAAPYENKKCAENGDVYQ